MKAPLSKRQVNLDLLRCLAMILIVLFHSIIHSGVLEAVRPDHMVTYFYVRFSHALSLICVNLFILISGYFLVKTKFRFQKLIALWGEMVFYSFVLKIIAMKCGRCPFSLISLGSCFFPFFTGRYWFLTIYLGLYLLAPFLNQALTAFDKHNHFRLLLVLFLIFPIWISIHPRFAGMNAGGGWGLTWFIVLYLCAAYLRLHNTSPGNKGIFWLLLCYMGIACIMAGMLSISEKMRFDFATPVFRNWYRYDSLPVLLMSLAVFQAFRKMQFTDGYLAKWISHAAPLTLGVYLIHDHANIKPWLWNVLALPQKLQSPFFPMMQIALVLGIFFACILLDAIRAGLAHCLMTNRVIKDTLKL